MSEGYTERLDGPDGQYIVLLTRLPYERAHMIEAAFETERSLAKRKDAVLRGLMWEAEVRNVLTGESAGDNLGAGDTTLIAEWRDRALELWVQWRTIAFPGPKESSGTGGRTRTSAKASANNG